MDPSRGQTAVKNLTSVWIQVGVKFLINLIPFWLGDHTMSEWHVMKMALFRDGFDAKPLLEKVMKTRYDMVAGGSRGLDLDSAGEGP